MTDILGEIVEAKRGIVERARREMPLREVKRRLRHGTFRASHLLRDAPWSLIAECKLASPSKGRLCDRPVTELARLYESNGAAMLSVHTDPHFDGCNDDLVAVRAMTALPILRKDFIIDEYQVYESRLLGADAVLLIARILAPERLLSLLYAAWGLGMDALIEVHDESDLGKALATPAELIGVNNRNLATFATDIGNTESLLAAHPGLVIDHTVISESGIGGAGDVGRLRAAGCQGALVGEGLVRADDIGAMTRSLAMADTARRTA